MEMDSLQYIKLLALMATTLLKVGVLLEGDLHLNSREDPTEGVLDHDGDGDDIAIVLVLMEGILGGLHLEEGPGVNNPRLHV